MLEGQEISEVFKSALERTLRIDSEFYKVENLNALHVLERHKPMPLTDFADVSDGNHMAIRQYFTDEGIPYYRGGDIYNFYIEQTPNPLRIPEEIYEINNLRRSHLKKGDVLVSIVGAIIGNLSLVKTDAKATCSCKLAILRPKTISPELLATFLKSKYGQNQIQKFRRGTGQTGLILEDFNQLLIPKFSTDFSDKIAMLINNSFEKLENSNFTYGQAEQLLLEEIDLKDFEPSKEAVNIKQFSESFSTSGRLDAEFYQPKFDSIEEVFNRFERIKISDLVDYPVSSGITPKAGGSDYTDKAKGIAFIRAVDLQNSEVNASDFNYIKPYVHETTLQRTQLQFGDVLFSIAGTVGRCAIFKHDFEANINQAVAILRFEETQIKKLYLIALLNSKLGKEFISKYSRQGLQTNLNLAEVGELSIPIIDYKKQEEIAELIEESFSLKKQSEKLLTLAKNAVELAIEKDENVALQFIDQQRL